MQSYLWIKTAHLVFVFAWVAAGFYLPRLLVNLAEAGDLPAVRARLVLMGRRLYRFGHVMFGLAVIAGLVLWFGYRFLPSFPTMVAPGSALRNSHHSTVPRGKPRASACASSG